MGTQAEGLKAFWKLLMLTLVILASFTPPKVSPAPADPATMGVWTEPFGLGMFPVHSVLLNDGRVMMVSHQTSSSDTVVQAWDPATRRTTTLPTSSGRDFYCAGHSLLPDGRVLFSSGQVQETYPAKDGVRDTDVFDPASNTWKSGPLLSEARWYPTNVQLPGGETLIFGGQKNSSTPSKTVDLYDPAINRISRLPASATRKVGLYPRLHLMPDAKLLWTNSSSGVDTKTTTVFNPTSSSWSSVAAMNFGTRHTGSSVLLPGLSRVLVTGGYNSARGTTPTAEILDYSAPTPRWRYTSPMSNPRRDANAVVLPDGKVLVVGGGRGPGKYQSPVLVPELFDPSSETWTVMASQKAPRMYHSTAVLLPDGRVLSAGQDRGSYQLTGEVYSPPYLFRGPRPTATSAPSAMTYGESFSVSTPDATTIERVALVSPSSVTHSINFNQRYVELGFSEADGNLSVSAPRNSREAPPGDYMMFLVNRENVPSVATWVSVS